MCCALVATLDAAVTDENQKQLQRLAEMTETLNHGDLASFLTASVTHAWSAPKIFSAWYIGKLPDDAKGDKAVERAKSEFGLALAKKLTEHAKRVRDENDSTKLEQLADPLFNLVRWLDGKQGYANLFLMGRAFDIASVVAAKLVADLKYPLDRAQTAFNRFDWKWSGAEIRRQVLHEESGFIYFKKPMVADMQSAIDKEWGTNFDAALEPSKVKEQPALRMFVYQDTPPGANNALPETVWFQRGHQKLADGWGSVNLRNLAGLLEFRKRYGEFPTKTKQYKKRKDETEIEAAFWELSWRNPYGVETASVIYSQYLNGTLCDDGEAQRRLDTRK